MDIEGNLREFLGDGIRPDGRDASFDYCFNYFQTFRESREIYALASPSNVEMSCLQLGFYLASWGMYRGSATLLQKSVRYLVPVIAVIAQTDISLWEIDAHCYTESNVERLLELSSAIRESCPDMKNGMSDTLVTKIMLGVFGNVPAFDTYFRHGCKALGMVETFNSSALKQIGAFYTEHAEVIENGRQPTISFATGEPTQRTYTRAKVIDMAFFCE